MHVSRQADKQTGRQAGRQANRQISRSDTASDRIGETATRGVAKFSLGLSRSGSAPL